MDKNYLNIYNNLVRFSRNKIIYSFFTKNDTFSDRLIILMFHFAFFINIYKKNINKEEMQNLYDFFFRQLELSIREIGYGDATINKKMKNYINTFHAILIDLNNWSDMDILKKNEIIKKFLDYEVKFNNLSEYFDKYNDLLRKKSFNSFLKSVINLEI